MRRKSRPFEAAPHDGIALHGFPHHLIPRVGCHERSDPDIDPDDIGIDPAGVWVPSVDESVAFPDLVAVIASLGVKSAQAFGGQEGQGTRRGAWDDGSIEWTAVGRATPTDIAFFGIAGTHAPQRLIPFRKTSLIPQGPPEVGPGCRDGVFEPVGGPIHTVAKIEPSMGKLMNEERGGRPDESLTLVNSFRPTPCCPRVG